MNRFVRLGFLAAAGIGLAACGVRGSLDAPPEAKADVTARADSGQGKPEGATPKPHKEFILDGLLR
jgi:predicted small lipoprotein YifL